MDMIRMKNRKIVIEEKMMRRITKNMVRSLVVAVILFLVATPIPAVENAPGHSDAGKLVSTDTISQGVPARTRMTEIPLKNLKNTK